MPAFNREKAAQILVDALVTGDKAAAAKWRCSEKTVRNHRARLDTDPAFAAFFQRLQARQSGDWRSVRLRFLRAGIAKLEALVREATPDQIKDVATAIRTVGELQVASDALNVDHGTHQPDEFPPPDASGGAQNAGSANTGTGTGSSVH